MKKEIEELKQIFEKQTGHVKFDGNKREIITLCPNCEKDKFNTNVKHGHLYISTNNLIFNCFKCGYSGFITKLLKLFKLNFEDVFKNVNIDTLLSNLNNSRNSKLSFNDDKEIEFRETVNNNIINKEEKINYLKLRIPYIDNVENIQGILLDIDSFIRSNKVIFNFQNENFYEYLNKNFIGFLTNRRTNVICRNIDKTSEFRYFKLSLNKCIFFKDFYGIKIKELLTNDLNTIVLCEGVFDVLNILYRPETKHIINKANFIAANLNNQYVNLLLSVLDYLKINRCNLIICSDSDVDKKNYLNMYKHPCVNNLDIYYNNDGKDFADEKLAIRKEDLKCFLKK